jgi:hypothetical protein
MTWFSSSYAALMAWMSFRSADNSKSRHLEATSSLRHTGDMATAEEKRLDLYNGLQEVLGTHRTTTLMTYLPSVESPDLLTKTEFRTEMAEFRSEIRGQLDKINSRIDRVLLAVVGSLVAIVAAVFTAG